MKAAVLHGRSDLRVEERADPTPGPRDVVIEVHACGVSGWDVQEYVEPRTAAPGQVLGHEFAGLIAARGVDADPRLKVGDFVTAMPLLGCDRCPSCLEGASHVCGVGVRIGAGGLAGAFADHVTVPGATLGASVFGLYGEVSAAEAALTAPLAVALHATEKLGAGRPGAVAVFGGGALGCLVAQLLAARGARWIGVVEPAEARRDAALVAGADVVVAPSSDDVASQLRDVAGDVEPDAVVECSGRPEMLATAVEVVRPGGRVVTAASYRGTPSIDMGVVVSRGLTLEGVSGARSRDFAAAVDLMGRGQVDVGRLLDRAFSLAEVTAAFRAASNPGASACGVRVTVLPRKRAR